jgi:hypothetical protein
MQQKRLERYLKQKSEEKKYHREPLLLCERCKPFGRCLAGLDVEEEVTQLTMETVEDYINIVPQWDPNAEVIRVYEAFHEGDYETAMLRGRAILDNGGGNDGLYIALATSYFFEKDYDNARRFIQYFWGVTNERAHVIKVFLEICSKKINENTNDKKLLVNATGFSFSEAVSTHRK